MIDLKRMLALVAALLCLAVPAASSAATITVNTTADGPGECATPGAPCTLRGALAEFQASSETEATIVIPAGHYILTEGQLSLARSGVINLVGAGARHTVIDAAGASRVLTLAGPTTGSSLNATVSGLTITGGAETTGTPDAGDGGGILLAELTEHLTLRGVAVVGNSATTNGGGIAAPLESGVPKNVVVEDSTIAGNKISGGTGVGLGGGLFVTGDLTMLNSTVTGNAIENELAANEGGGVAAGPGTGTEATQTRIVNSTIAGNSVTTGTGGGFAMYNPTALAATSSTITNTIVAGNTAAGASANCGGVLTVVSSHNLSDDESCMFTDTGSKKAADPKLGPLANNGGETDTLALLAGSPAIDAGTAEGCPATDQRGVPRPSGPACDIGAYEYQAPAPTPAGPVTPASADLRLTIKPKPKKPRRGRKLGFLVKVRDAGPSAATNVVLKGRVPATAARPKVKGLGKGACKLSKAKKGKSTKGKSKKGKRTITCSLGTLAAGQTVSFRIPVRTRHTPRKLAVAGAVTSSVADPTPANAKAKAVVKLKG